MTAFTQLTLALAPGVHASKAGALRRRIEPGWQVHGACVDTDDPDAWYPSRTASPDEIADALAICAGCPVPVLPRRGPTGP